MASTLTPARLLMAACNLLYSVGAFAADFNETHVLNPRWPPHARFHNGQTMSLGILLASSAIYYAFRPTASASAAKEALFTSALIGSFYCVAGLSAIFYPGTDWHDPEFKPTQQKWLFSGIVIVNWIGYAVEMRRLAKVKGG